MLKTTKDFKDIREAVTKEMATEKSFFVKTLRAAKMKLSKIADYAPSGLQSCGKKLDFPAAFVEKHYKAGHESTAEAIVKNQVNDYFSSSKRRTDDCLYVRTFYDKIYAVLTQKYRAFDDDEVISLCEGNDYLMNAAEYWYNVEPDHFHVRFISQNKLTIPGDDSPLSMAVFVSNSMTGDGAFKIQFGIYRWACTNGMIAKVKDFTVIKQAHKGKRDYRQLVAKAISEVPMYEEMLLDMVKDASTTASSIKDMKEEDALEYIKRKLDISKDDSIIIFDHYKRYASKQGHTKWALCNAITDFAHAKESIVKRMQLESKALEVA